MIIEFYGMPGTGKTTVAKRLAAGSGWQLVKINSRRELLFYNFIFFLNYPLKFFTLFYYLCRFGFIGGVKLFYLKLMNVFLAHNAKYIKARQFKNAVIDQGHWQNIISLFENKMTAAVISRYARHFIYPDKLFIFNLGAMERRRRMERRGYGVRDGRGEDYKKRWLAVIEHNDQILQDCIGKIGVNYCQIKTDRPPKELSGEIIGFLKK